MKRLKIRKKFSAPTCTEQGFTTSTCEFCGYAEKKDYVDALGHDWDEGVIDEEAKQICFTCGISKDKFGPNDFCTRGQVVTFLYRYHNYLASQEESNGTSDAEGSFR